MNITIKYFASIRETIGLPSESLHTGAATLAASVIGMLRTGVIIGA